MNTPEFNQMMETLRAQLEGKKKTFAVANHWVFHDAAKGVGLDVNMQSYPNAQVETFTLEGYDPQKKCYTNSKVLTSGYYSLSAKQNIALTGLMAKSSQ